LKQIQVYNHQVVEILIFKIMYVMYELCNENLARSKIIFYNKNMENKNIMIIHGYKN